MARDFDRQVAELQVRIAVLNRYSALGIPIIEPIGSVRLGKGEVRSNPDLCNRAFQVRRFNDKYPNGDRHSGTDGAKLDA